MGHGLKTLFPSSKIHSSFHYSKSDSYLADSETGEDTDAFFSFFPEPGPLVPLLCFGDPLDFLDVGESLLSGSGEA